MHATAIVGHAALTPAGPTPADLLAACREQRDIPCQTQDRAPGASHRFRGIGQMLSYNRLRHARLRRAPVVARLAVAAALDALDAAGIDATAAGGSRVGVVFALMNGCVAYSNRFFGEVLADPATASPILFPETVYNAPASHLSALLGQTAPNYTQIGDTGVFAVALHTARLWLAADQCDLVVVATAEEHDWLTAEAPRLLHQDMPMAEAAAALVLAKADAARAPVARLETLTSAHPIAGRAQRAEALRAARRELEADGPLPDDALLVTSSSGSRADRRDDQAAWAGFAGPRLAPLPVIGRPFGATAGVQFALAVEALRAGVAREAVVSAAGNNHQVVMARLVAG